MTAFVVSGMKVTHGSKRLIPLYAMRRRVLCVTLLVAEAGAMLMETSVPLARARMERHCCSRLASM